MRDEAMLVWWTRFYADEHVLQMSYEQQGVYWRLLALAWENDGLPNDVGRLAKMLGLSRSRFDRLWPDIAPCWHDDGHGRLRQKRQEIERQTRQAHRTATSPPTTPASGDRSERMRQLANARWGRRHANADAVPHADAHAQSDAHAHASRNAHRIDAGCVAASPPTPPSEQVQPQAHDAAPHADAHATHASAVGPAPGRGPAAARAARDRKLDDGTSPIADLTAALLGTRYRGGITNAIARRAAVREEATRLLATGLGVADVRALAALAETKSNGDPGALLAHWLDGEAWREVLDEQSAKAKEAGARRPGQDDQDPVLDGIYGAPNEPRAAASVVDDVLRSARTA